MDFYSNDDDFDSLSVTPMNNTAVAIDWASRNFAIFPVRDWGDGDGPKPIKDFPNRASANYDQVAEWWRRWPDAAVGLLCGERNGISVLDIDRKKGKDGFASLATRGFPDIEQMSPCRARSKSRGSHLFFRYEPRLINSAGVIGEGLDVRTTGAFVIAAGSIVGEGRYSRDGEPLGSVDLPPFPETLIPEPAPDRPTAEPLADATQEQREWAADYLRNLSDELAALAEGNRNPTLNAMAMWAGGAGAHGFLTHEQAEDALVEAAIQAGLPKRSARSTFKSGWKAGMKKPISRYPGADAEDDDYSCFDNLDDKPQLAATDTDSFDSLMDDKPAAATDSGNDHGDIIAKMNRKHALIMIGGKSVIAAPGETGAVDFWQTRAFHEFYANRRLPVKDPNTGKPKPVPVSQIWMAHPKRRTYPGGVTFAPDGASDRQFNLWRGWAVEPDADASCSLFLDHIRHVVCRGNEDHAAYVVGWLAHMVQHPAQKPGVGLVVRGGKGAGKDTVADYVARMIGRRHAPTVAESDHIVGKFNARLENALLLHVQEGSWAGDRKAEGVLKYLVTSDRVEIERKGIDSINMPSVLRLFISANAEWVVPASADERRWAVFNVSDTRRGNEAYFAALRAEMNGRGPAALLHYLRAYDLSGFDVRKAPETDALRDQKIVSLRGFDLWWFETLSQGSLDSGSLDGDDTWAESPIMIGRDALRARYVEWTKGRRFDGEAVDDRRFGRRLREMVPALEDKRLGGRVNRVRQYALPSLIDCRAAFEAWLRAPVDWDACD